MLPTAAVEYDEKQRRLVLAARILFRSAWSGMGPDFDASWQTVGAQVRIVAFAAQVAAASAAEPYLAAVLPELGIPAEQLGTIVPRAFAGMAGDGRPVASLLEGAVVAAKEAQSLEAGGRWLDTTTRTLIADTGRLAVATGIAARPAVTGYVRMLQTPSCSRCAILAGKKFRWNTGFARHPNCDCIHVPSIEAIAGDMTTDPKAALAAGQVTGLTKAQREAIDGGANFAKVVNASRGTAIAGQQGNRLTPETINSRARNRKTAVAELKAHGYLAA